MKKRYYAVMKIWREGSFQFGKNLATGEPVELKVDFEDKETGVVGMIPVFTNKKKALKHEKAIMQLEEDF